jgi:hypothetical protein
VCGYRVKSVICDLTDVSNYILSTIRKGLSLCDSTGESILTNVFTHTPKKKDRLTTPFRKLIKRFRR